MSDRRDAEVARVSEVRYWREREARVVVEAWTRSGESVGAFAERYGIHARRLSRWAARLEEFEERAEPVPFHPVRVVGGGERTRSERAPLEIVLGDGCTVRVAPGFAAEDLARVLEVLGPGPGC